MSKLDHPDEDHAPLDLGKPSATKAPEVSDDPDPTKQAGCVTNKADGPDILTSQEGLALAVVSGQGNCISPSERHPDAMDTEPVPDLKEAYNCDAVPALPEITSGIYQPTDAANAELTSLIGGTKAAPTTPDNAGANQSLALSHHEDGTPDTDGANQSLALSHPEDVTPDTAGANQPALPQDEDVTPDTVGANQPALPQDEDVTPDTTANEAFNRWFPISIWIEYLAWPFPIGDGRIYTLYLLSCTEFQCVWDGQTRINEVNQFYMLWSTPRCSVCYAPIRMLEPFRPVSTATGTIYHHHHCAEEIQDLIV